MAKLSPDIEKIIRIGLQDVWNRFGLPGNNVFEKYVEGEILRKKELIEAMMIRDKNTDGKAFPLGGPGTVLNSIVMYAIVRETKAKKILETGVANGFTTSFLLAAAIENGASLDSVEISPLKEEVAKHTPQEYKQYDKWNLNIGVDSLEFLKNIEEMDYDFYCHDSLHTLFHMKEELGFFKKCNKDKFYMFFDDQNDDNFWNICLDEDLFHKENFLVRHIDGASSRLGGHLGGFLGYTKRSK